MTYLLLASIVLAIVVTWMREGRLSRLGEIEFRLWWVVPLVTLAQFLIIRFSDSPSRLKLWSPRPLIMIASYVILWAVVWQNRHLPGMWIVLLGVTLNMLAIAANGGYMPIPPKALAQIGVGDAAYQMSVGSVVLGSKDVLLPPEQAHFAMLGDVLIIPKPFPWSAATSIGDWVLAVGIFWFITQTAQSGKHSFSEYPEQSLTRSGTRSEASYN
jgi:hypothetical protein